MHTITPFPDCPALDGYHCQTNSLAKIYHHYKASLTEEMILGLGAGMGYIYWQMKGNPQLKIPDYVFIGGRGNTKNFFEDLSTRTGVKITQHSTASQKKAEGDLLTKLHNQEPVMVFADMGFLPWFDLPKDYHFGGHTIVLCGYDGKETVLASDIDQKASGLKKGFYSPITLGQLRNARGSTFKPFPPKNTFLNFNFKGFHTPSKKDLYTSIQQTIDAMCKPPISNIGIQGLRKTARMIQHWPTQFTDHQLRMNLFSLYVFIEIGGTGGACFRSMYARFLEQAAALTKNTRLLDAAKTIHAAGKMFSTVGLLFQDAEIAKNLSYKIDQASELFEQIADIEEEAYAILQSALKD